MKGLVDVVALAGILYVVWQMVVSAAQWFFAMVASRFDVPPPVGVHEIAIGHPERAEVEFSDHERDVLLVLDATTEWENA